MFFIPVSFTYWFSLWHMLDQTLLNSKSPYITPLQKRVLEERVIVTICLMVLDHVQELFKQFIWYSNACMTLASQQVKTRKRICCYIVTSNILWIHNNRYRLFIQKMYKYFGPFSRSYWHRPQYFKLREIYSDTYCLICIFSQKNHDRFQK